MLLTLIKLNTIFFLVTSICYLNQVKKTHRTSVDNKQVTAFTNLEETLAGNRKHIPFSLEDELKNRGAIFKKAKLPYALFLVSDQQIITGQSPCAAGAIAKEIIHKLHNVTDSLKEAQKVFIQDNSKSFRPGC